MIYAYRDQFFLIWEFILKNVGKEHDLFGIEIAYYGIIIGTAIFAWFFGLLP